MIHLHLYSWMVHVCFLLFVNRAMMMTACDLCGITKPWKIQREVGNIICSVCTSGIYIEKLGNMHFTFQGCTFGYK